MPRKTKTDPQELSKPERKPLVWLSGEVKTPPFTAEGRMEAGELLRALQEGQALRVRDAGQNWRIMYPIDKDAVVILEVYGKKTQKIPDEVIDRCKDRLKKYDAIAKSTKTK